MMFIPGWLLNALTFPGLIFHELGVYLVCKMLRLTPTISPFDFLYGGSGEIVQVNDLDFIKHSSALSYVPIFLCTAACIAFAYCNQYTAKGSLIEFLVTWFSISAGIHGFPLKHFKRSWVMSLIGLEIIYAIVLFLIFG
jgi:hypothetical protein